MFEKVKKVLEYSPILLGIIFCSIFLRYFNINKIETIKIDRLELILEILIPSLITYIGFIITAITIIIGLNKGHILKMIAREMIFRLQMTIYFLVPILLSIIIIFIAFCGLIFIDGTCTINVSIVSIFIGLAVYLVFSTIRIVWVLLYIFDDEDYVKKNELVIDSSGERLNLSNANNK